MFVISSKESKCWVATRGQDQYLRVRWKSVTPTARQAFKSSFHIVKNIILIFSEHFELLIWFSVFYKQGE